VSFARAEYAARLAAVRARMAARGVDVLPVDEIEHLAWVAGWHASGSERLTRLERRLFVR